MKKLDDIVSTSLVVALNFLYKGPKLAHIAATACMACALVVIRWGLSAWPNELALIKLLVMVITGVLVYAASLFFIDLPMWRELQQVCSWAFGGGRGIKRTLELPA